MTITQTIAPDDTNLSPAVIRFHNTWAALCTLLLIVGAALLYTGVISPIDRQGSNQLIWGIFSELGLFMTWWVMAILNRFKPSSLLCCSVPALVAIAVVLYTSSYVM